MESFIALCGAALFGFWSFNKWFSRRFADQGRAAIAAAGLSSVAFMVLYIVLKIIINRVGLDG